MNKTYAVPFRSKKIAAYTLRKTALALAISQVLLLGVSGAQAVTITVDSSADDNGTGCTLREAIANANDTTTGGSGNGCVAGDPAGADTITFDTTAMGTSTATLDTLGKGPLPVTSDITIDGAGAVTIDANNGPGSFFINSGAQATLSGLTLTGSTSGAIGAMAVKDATTTATLVNTTVTGNTGSSKAGGIYLYDGTLNLVNSTVSGNSVAAGASNKGGGIFIKGVSGNPSLTLNNSTVSSNSVDQGAGGGIATAGQPASVSISSNSTISGNSAAYGGGIHIGNSGTSVSIVDSTVTTNSASANGGGIFVNNGSSLTVQNSTISNNTGGNIASTSSGGYGGGIYANGATLISISGSTVSGNQAGVYYSAGGGGIFATNASNVTLNNSTVSGNTATSTNGATGKGGGIAINSSTLNLTNSTLSDNSAEIYGGGIYSANNATVNLTNSTISGNQVTYASLALGGAIAAGQSTVTLTNTTVAANSSSQSSGGLILFSGSTLNLTNSLLANNTAPAALSTGNGNIADCDSIFNGVNAATVNETGNNIIQTDNCGTASQHVDAMLGALADNGGPTLTMLPLTGSPAIDGGDQTACTSNSITTDQRGVARNDGTCDIGAVEAAVLASLQFSTTSSSVNEGSGSVSIAVTRSGGTTNAVSVDYTTVDGAAVSTPVSNADFTATSGTLNFATGVTSQTITVPITDDALAEGDETFSVSLSNPSATTGSAVLGTNTSTTVTISDNDSSRSSSSSGGGALDLLSLLAFALLWPLRRWQRRT